MPRRPAGGVIGENYVRADALHLFQNVIPAGERNGDHQDDRRRPDHHAEAGQKRADGIGSQSLRAETEGFAEEHRSAALRLAKEFGGFRLGRVFGAHFSYSCNALIIACNI